MPAAATTVRRERAVRPCFPMTLPRSPGATFSSTTLEFSPSTSRTTTDDGSSTSAFAMNSTSSFIARRPRSDLRALRLRQKAAHGFGGVRALLDPRLGLGDVELDRLGMRSGVVGTEALDEPALRRRAALGH